MNTRLRSHSTALALLLMLLPGRVFSALAYEYAGLISAVPADLSALGIQVNDPWQLTVEFDENEPDTLPALSTRGKYLNGQGSLTIGSLEWLSTPTNSFTMELGDETSAPPFSGPPQDWVFLSIAPVGPAVDGLVPRSLRVELSSSAGFLNEQPLDSDELPRRLDIGDWRFAGMELIYWPGDGTPSTTDPSLRGSVSAISVSAVPVPAAVWLFGSALLGLGVPEVLGWVNRSYLSPGYLSSGESLARALAK